MIQVTPQMRILVAVEPADFLDLRDSAQVGHQRSEHGAVLRDFKGDLCNEFDVLILGQSQITKALVIMNGPFLGDELLGVGQHLGDLLADRIGRLVCVDPAPVQASGVVVGQGRDVDPRGLSGVLLC